MELVKTDSEPEFVALAKAINTQNNAFGIYGPATKAAVKKYNKKYATEADGEKITAYTLTTINAHGFQVAEAALASAETAAKVGVELKKEEVKKAEVEVKKAEAKVEKAIEAAKAAPSDLVKQAEVKKAEVEVKKAEVVVEKAKEQVVEAKNLVNEVQETQTETVNAIGPWYDHKYGGLPVWAIALIGAGITTATVMLVRRH